MDISIKINDPNNEMCLGLYNHKITVIKYSYPIIIIGCYLLFYSINIKEQSEFIKDKIKLKKLTITKVN